MPVEDVTVEWPESLSPFVTVAKLRIPQQDISGDDNLEKMDALSFTPWRVTAEHLPLGNIMRLRKEVYRHSSILRHKLNHQNRTEPGSADQVLPINGGTTAPRPATPVTRRSMSWTPLTLRNHVKEAVPKLVGRLNAAGIHLDPAKIARGARRFHKSDPFSRTDLILRRQPLSQL
jgi:hypothetical protein